MGGSVFECDALFLQPTYTCGKNCLGCYVKAQEKNRGNHSTKDRYFWLDLIGEVLTAQTKIRPKQVTLALDTLPSKNHLLYSKQHREWMINLANYYFLFAERKGFKHRNQCNNTEAHITVNCVNDIRAYKEEVNEDNYLSNGLSLVSISNINGIEDIRYARETFPGAKINWNILSTSLVDIEKDKIKEILRHVDNCYLLLNKAPTGRIGNQISAFMKSLELVESIRDKDNTTIPGTCKVPDPTSKIVVDHCISDAVKFHKTGFGCSANISKFQVWPDGRVTGCAYNALNQYDNASTTLDDVVANLFSARKRYEFSMCTIPNELQQIRK